MEKIFDTVGDGTEHRTMAIVVHNDEYLTLEHVRPGRSSVVVLMANSFGHLINGVDSMVNYGDVSGAWGDEVIEAIDEANEEYDA